MGSEDVDTSTDVYALGLMLYEMLASRMPYVVRGTQLSQAQEIIQNEEPPLLSTFNPECAGDVEMMIAKAIEKSPSRRYRSANDFGDDIQRYLDDEPVTARPPGTGGSIHWSPPGAGTAMSPTAPPRSSSPRPRTSVHVGPSSRRWSGTA